MSYQIEILEKLKSRIKAKQSFTDIKKDIISKLGNKMWEKLLYRAKIQLVLENKN